MIWRHPLRHTGDFHQRAQADIVRARQTFEAGAHENPILTGQRHEIRHCAECDEVEVIAQVDCQLPVLLEKRVREFERNTDAGQHAQR